MSTTSIILHDYLIPSLTDLLSKVSADIESVQYESISDVALWPCAQKNRVTALFVRSTTRVDSKLIQQFPNLQFVASATSGINHLNVPHLQQAGMTWCDAKGSNAKAVADYVIYALHLLRRQSVKLQAGRSVIVGFGFVGQQVSHNLQQLGLHSNWVDPFLQQTEQSLALSEAGVEPWLEDTTLLCIHTPLRTDEPWPTKNWLSEKRLACLPDGAVVICAGRGETLNQKAITKHASRLVFIMDVWPEEPWVGDILPFIAVATPHIAGHSRLGKLKGTWQVFQHYCRFLHIQGNISEDDFYQEASQLALTTPVKQTSSARHSRCVSVLNNSLLVHSQLQGCDDLQHTDQNMREQLQGVKSLSQDDAAARFYALRRQYKQHPEIIWTM